MDLLLTARWVLPIVSPPIENAAILVRDGRIVDSGPRESLQLEAGSCRRMELGEAALLPGLVNVHAHLELTVLRGFLEERDFFRWIRKLTETKYNLLSPEELRVSACWGALEAVRGGVTTVGELCDLGVAREALVSAGLRGVLYQEVFGPASEDAESSLATLEERLREHEAAAGERLAIGVSPHAPYTVSPELFVKVTDLALERGYPVSIHAEESHAERALMLEGTGPFAEHLRGRGISWDVPGCSTIEYLEKLGVLRTRPLLAHCVQCSTSDIERIVGSGSSVAHCPKSNARFGHGTAPLSRMREMGVRVGLGTDSVASNNTGDLFEEGRFASLLERLADRETPTSGVSARDALRQLTLAGAEALRMEERIGSLEPGKEADVIAVDLSAPHLEPVSDVEATLVWSASASDVTFTMVGGEVLYSEGRFTRLDEEGLRRELEGIARKLREA